MRSFGQYFQVIQLYRVPFLTTEVLSQVVPGMSRLLTLGVYRYPLIHIGSAMDLLEIIRRGRPSRKEYQVSLDFFPNFHFGPVYHPDRKNATGWYGVTWDNFERRSELAIWQLMTFILPQARAQGVDFFSHHTAFRKWLELSPCWKTKKVLVKMSKPETTDRELVALFCWRNFQGKVSKIMENIPEHTRTCMVMCPRSLRLLRSQQFGYFLRQDRIPTGPRYSSQSSIRNSIHCSHPLSRMPSHQLPR